MRNEGERQLATVHRLRPRLAAPARAAARRAPHPPRSATRADNVLPFNRAARRAPDYFDAPPEGTAA